MLVYEKGTGENRHLYGTLENIPSDSDNQLVYKDRDGDVLTDLTLSDSYVDDGHGGILLQSREEKTFVDVYIKKQDNSLVNIIPGDADLPEEKVLESIRFKRKPTKTNYIVGEELNYSGAIIEATFVSGEKEIIANDAEGMSWTFEPGGGIAAAIDDTSIRALYEFDGVEQYADYTNITISPE